MIEIITPGNRGLYGDALEAMFRLRHRIFVKDMGWTLPGAGDGVEQDAFDTEETVYFIEREANGAILACARLNPTTGPHMLTDLFADYCDLAPPPTGPEIHELSRVAVDREMVDPRRRREIRGRLDWAIAWHCRRNMIERLTAFPAEEAYTDRLRLWKTRPLGLPATFNDGRAYIPAVLTVDEGLPARIAEWHGFSADTPICMQRYDGALAEVFPVCVRTEA